MKVALYLRVSTEQQVEKYGIPMQRERLHAFCTAKGWSEVTEYVDGAYSGSNLNRPALEQLQKDIKKNKVNVVVVYRLDRLSRSQRDTLYLIEEVFTPYQVEFISLSETIDTSTPFGRAAIGVLSVFAQLERETIASRLWNCHRKMVQEKGLWSGSGDKVPYGYKRLDDGSLVIEEQACHHVKTIFETYLSLQSFTQVKHQLEKEGFKEIELKRIIRILKNKVYIGEVSFAGEWFKGSHEPIISQELFDQVQATIQDNKGTYSTNTKNKVFTKKVFCGKCGEEYRPNLVKTKAANKTFKTRLDMVCQRCRLPSRYESKCFSRRIKREDFEKEVFHRIERLGSSGEIKLKSKPINFEKEQARIDKKIAKLLDLYMDDRLSKFALDEKLKTLNEQKEELLRQEQLAEKEQSEIEELIQNGIPNLLECDLQTQTEIVHLLIKKIIVTDDGLDIIWNQ